MKTELRCLVIADIHSPCEFRLPLITSQHCDLVLTLGDIPSGTIDYILCMCRSVPVYGVLGNHDPIRIEGLDVLHIHRIAFHGIRIGGHGGARRYMNHPNHYTDRQVRRNLRRMPAVDLFISHAPPLATSQDQDDIHRGFPEFDRYLHEHRPQHWLHGHLERNYEARIGATVVHGVVGKRYLTLPFELYPNP